MIHRALRLLRIFHAQKQKELAKMLDVSASHLCEIENGNKPVSFELLEKYASVFKIPVSTIALFAESVDSKSRSKANEIPRKAIQLLEWFDSVTSTDSQSVSKL